MHIEKIITLIEIVKIEVIDNPATKKSRSVKRWKVNQQPVWSQPSSMPTRPQNQPPSVPPPVLSVAPIVPIPPPVLSTAPILSVPTVPSSSPNNYYYQPTFEPTPAYSDDEYTSPPYTYKPTPCGEEPKPKPKPTPDKPSPSKPSPDKPSPSKPSPDKPSPSKPSPDKPSPSKPSPDKPSPDKPKPKPKPDPGCDCCDTGNCPPKSDPKGKPKAASRRQKKMRSHHSTDPVHNDKDATSN